MSSLSFNCPVCGFQLYQPVAEFGSCVLGLYDDARFPGRSLLAFNEHYEDLSTMPAAKAHAFLDDLRLAGLAIQTATGADRMNYAVLGNAEPHVHAHIIPRKRTDDPVPNKAPWAHPDPVRPLSPDVLADLIQRIARAIESLRSGNLVRRA